MCIFLSYPLRLTIFSCKIVRILYGRVVSKTGVQRGTAGYMIGIVLENEEDLIKKWKKMHDFVTI